MADKKFQVEGISEPQEHEKVQTLLQRWAEHHAHWELPMPSTFSPTGSIILQVAQAHLFKIAEEEKNKVIKISLENSRFTREDHEKESKLSHTRRFHRRSEQKSLLNRKIDKIQQS